MFLNKFGNEIPKGFVVFHRLFTAEEFVLVGIDHVPQVKERSTDLKAEKLPKELYPLAPGVGGCGGDN